MWCGINEKNQYCIGGEAMAASSIRLHYGRDSLVGVALFLTYLANKKNSCRIAMLPIHNII
jgi:phosphomannomutase